MLRTIFWKRNQKWRTSYYSTSFQLESDLIAVEASRKQGTEVHLTKSFETIFRSSRWLEQFLISNCYDGQSDQ